jgi:hypothetical protein
MKEKGDKKSISYMETDERETSRMHKNVKIC